MSTPPFVHLHCHSHYSLLDGAGSIDRLIERAKALRMNALALTEYLISRSWRPRQVQDFVPIPLTLSAAMYVSSRDARKREIYIPSGRGEKRLQAAMLQYYQPRNKKVVADFLKSVRRADLLGKIRHLQLPKRSRRK